MNAANELSHACVRSMQHCHTYRLAPVLGLGAGCSPGGACTTALQAHGPTRLHAPDAKASTST